MKLEVYKESKAEAEADDNLYLKLQETDDGVALRAISPDGIWRSFGRLVTFSADGTVFRNSLVSPALKLPLEWDSTKIQVAE